MKKIYLLPFALFAAITSHAQYDLNKWIDPLGWPVNYPGSNAFDTIDYYITQDADGSGWQNVEKIQALKNVQGDATLFGTYLWSDTVNGWVPQFEISFSYTYNGNNQAVTMIRTQELGIYAIVRYGTYMIDGNGNYTEGNYVDSLHYGGTTYFSTAKDELTYNGSGQLTSRTYFTSDVNSTTLEEDDKWTYSYSGGNLTEILAQSWDGTAWENDEKQTLAYNGSNELIQVVNQYWTGTAWQNDDKSDYTYDASGRLDTRTEYIDTTNAWQNDKRVTYTYISSTGQGLDSYIEELGNGNTWTNDHQYEVSYNASEPSFALGYPWTGSAFSTVAAKRILFTDTGASGGSAPNPPGNLGANASGRASLAISLTWDDNSDNEEGFTIERSLDGNSFTLLADVAADAEGYTDTNGLVSATQYYYRVLAYNQYGSSAPSNTADAITWTLAVEEAVQAEISSYPNPVKEQLNIRCNTHGVYEINNLAGALVQRGTINPGLNSIDVNPLRSGLYILSVVSDRYKMTEPLIKN